jgi:hypothetical protein
MGLDIQYMIYRMSVEYPVDYKKINKESNVIEVRSNL